MEKYKLNFPKQTFLTKEAILIILATWITYILLYPINNVYFYEYFPYSTAFKYKDYFNLDPLAAIFWPKSLPVTFELFYNIFVFRLIYAWTIIFY